ncbi:hypothetical protein ACTA71_010619 [Dictyostelium dimigraforme]
MQKLKRDITTILLFVVSFVLFSISLKSYWYKIKFSDNELYYFRYTNIEIENYIIGNQSQSTDIPQSQSKWSAESYLLSLRLNEKSSDSSTIIKDIGYGEAKDTQDVFLTCLTCAIVSSCCNFIILLLQLINLKIKSKHNAFLMCILSKVIGFIGLAFNIGSVLYLLSFREYFDKECNLLGNCLITPPPPPPQNNSNDRGISGSNIINSSSGVNGIDSIGYTSNSALEFIGSTDKTYYRPHIGWLLNVIAFFFFVAGISFLFIPKDKKKKPNKYKLLV